MKDIKSSVCILDPPTSSEIIIPLDYPTLWQIMFGSYHCTRQSEIEKIKTLTKC